MAENTKIEWAHHTFNPWYGCQRVGPGCDHCYAEGWAKRSGLVQWGAGADRRRSSEAIWRKPLHWNRQAEIQHNAWQAFKEAHPGLTDAQLIEAGFSKPERPRVFCASLADVFDNAVPASWRADLFQLIERTPYLDWLLVTKRIGNVRDMAPVSWIGGPIQHGPDPSNIHGGWPPNVWLGITVVNQSEADRDIPKLLALPARVRFLSMEPLLGPVDLRFHIFSEPTGNFRTHAGKRQMELRKPADGGLHWVIVGGESGPNARPMHPGWVQSLRDQCLSSGIAFLFKQWGEWRAPLDGEEYDTTMGRAQRVPAFIVAPSGTVHCFENEQTSQGGCAMLRVGKKKAGRELDGLLHDGYPAPGATA